MNKNAISENTVRKKLNTLRLGKRLQVFDIIDSTNAYAKTLSDDCDGTVIVANEQTAGRGRTTRKFISSPDGLYLSFIIKPDNDNLNAGLLTLAVALSVKKTVESVSDIKAMIKWPNDILYEGKKLCGILSESVIDASCGKVKKIVCGIGINCNNLSFPDEIADTATSLRIASKKEIDKTALLIRLLTQLDKTIYKKPYYLNCDTLIGEYKKSLLFLGEAVRIIYPEHELIGVPTDIDSNGGLVLKLEDNKTKIIYSGEIKLRPKDKLS